MGRQGVNTTSSYGGIPQDSDITCSKCGRTAKSSHGWVTGADGAILCAGCHRDLISERIDDRHAEMFGHEMARYFSSLRYRCKPGGKGGNESDS
jgi:predicted CXXCH cytochrome family protein